MEKPVGRTTAEALRWLLCGRSRRALGVSAAASSRPGARALAALLSEGRLGVSGLYE